MEEDSLKKCWKEMTRKAIGSNGAFHTLNQAFLSLDPPQEQVEVSVMRTWMHSHTVALANITALNLDMCKLSHLPSEIQLFSHLEHLSVSHNALTFLPPWLGS